MSSLRPELVKNQLISRDATTGFSARETSHFVRKSVVSDVDKKVGCFLRLQLNKSNEQSLLSNLTNQTNKQTTTKQGGDVNYKVTAVIIFQSYLCLHFGLELECSMKTKSCNYLQRNHKVASPKAFHRLATLSCLCLAPPMDFLERYRTL